MVRPAARRGSTPPRQAARRRAAGAQRTENAGSSASALRAQRRSDPVARATLDLGPVEVEERVPRTEAERAVGPRPCLVAAARAGERPPERVVADDRRPFGTCGSGTRDERPRPIRWSASRRPTRRRYERRWRRGCGRSRRRSSPGAPRLRGCRCGHADRRGGRRTAEAAPHRLRSVQAGSRAGGSACGLEACELLRGEHVAGHQLERRGGDAPRVGGARHGDRASRARRSPRRRLTLGGRRIGRKLHRRDARPRGRRAARGRRRCARTRRRSA